MRTRAALVAGIAVVLLLAWSRSASAHPTGVSYGEYTYRDHKIFAGLTFARRELARALPWLRGRDNVESLVAFEQGREKLGRWLVERLSVFSSGVPCEGAFDGMRFDGDGVAFALSYSCSGASEPIDLDARFVADLDGGHRHVAAVAFGEDRRDDVAADGRTRLSFDFASSTAATTSRSSFGSFVRMGIEHIATGYDHLLFLLGLVLVGGPFRSLLGAITAFTLAHSLTLAVAALGIWVPSPSIVEPGIALSIAYVGVENWFVHDARGRWRITLPFGLVHGFGFAGALREVAVPRSDIPAALFGFNTGVEIGQLAVLVALLPIVLSAKRRLSWEPTAMRACNAIMVLVGIAWFVARVRGSI